jgi:molybdate transport repressor ModE-like protein
MVHKKPEIAFDTDWLAAPGLSRERARSLVALLRELSQSSSLREAARASGVSYRFAWGLLSDAANAFGVPLVEMQRGKSARLSALGRRLVQADARVRQTLAEPLERLRSEIQLLLAEAVPDARRRLTLHASHDLAIAALPGLCTPAIELDVVFCGADDGLAALARGECDLAGFHVPDALPRAAAAAASLGKWLDSRKHVLLHFVRREQGLIARPGSKIRNVHDLARPGVRFIHRQNPADASREESVAATVARGSACARKRPSTSSPSYRWRWSVTSWRAPRARSRTRRSARCCRRSRARGSQRWSPDCPDIPQTRQANCIRSTRH